MALYQSINNIKYVDVVNHPLRKNVVITTCGYSLLPGNAETPEQLLRQEPPDEMLQADIMEEV